MSSRRGVRRAGGARKMMAFSRIHNITSEQEWMKILRRAKAKDVILIEFASATSQGSKGMQPYMSTISRTAEYSRIKMFKVDVDLVPDVAVSCGVKAIPTYQVWKNQEKIDEMSGALPQRLVTMLKTHNVAEGSRFKIIRLALTAGAVVAGVMSLLKYKEEIEAKERGQRKIDAKQRKIDEVKYSRKKEQERLRELSRRGELTSQMKKQSNYGRDDDDDDDDDDEEEEEYAFRSEVEYDDDEDDDDDDDEDDEDDE
jgi:thioredoxin 1